MVCALIEGIVSGMHTEILFFRGGGGGGEQLGHCSCALT